MLAENTAVIADTIPSRFGMLVTAYSTAIDATGIMHARTVVTSFVVRPIPLSLYKTVFL
jgi:hypothetical protein